MINRLLIALMYVVSLLFGILAPVVWFVAGMRHATGPSTYWPVFLKRILRK